MSKRDTRVFTQAFGLSGLLIGLVGAGCPAKTDQPKAGCTKDTDCKDARICEQGVCAPPTSGDGAEVDDATQPSKTGGDDAREPRDFYRGGPGHAGPTPHAGPEAEPKLVWERDLGAVVFATPALATVDGTPMIYVGTHAGQFYELNAETGDVVTSHTLGGRIWGTAAVGADGTVYIGSDDDKLFALTPGEADPKWVLEIGNCDGSQKPGPEGARCDVDGGPTIGPTGDLFIGADGVYRVSPAGEIVWHYTGGEDRPKHVFSTPAVDRQSRSVFGGQDGYVTALDAEGEQRWRYKVVADVDGSPSMGENGTTFVGADDGRLYAIRADGSLRWSFVAQKDIRSAVGTGAEGRLYATSYDGNLYAISEAGAVDWVLGTAAPIRSTPVVDSEGRIYFGGQDEHLYGVNDEGKVLWSIDVGADVDSSVAVGEDGTLFVGADDGKLRAYR